MTNSIWLITSTITGNINICDKFNEFSGVFFTEKKMFWNVVQLPHLMVLIYIPPVKSCYSFASVAVNALHCVVQLHYLKRNLV